MVLKFHSKPENNHHKKNSKSLSASLDDFRSKISNFLREITLFKSAGKGSKSHVSLEWFEDCFEMISFSDKAFAKLVIEIEYPMSEWGGKATDEYLNYSLSFLEKLNSISSSLSHLNQARISISHALGLIEKDLPSLLSPVNNKLGKDFKVKGPSSSSSTTTTGIGKRPGSDQKERAVLEALMVLKKIGFLALGLVLSGLCGDAAKPCLLEIGKFPGGCECDDLLKIHENIIPAGGSMEEVKEVNRAVERLSEGILYNGKCNGEAVRELKGRLVVLENCIQGVEKIVKNMFSQVLGVRTKLMDNIRFIGLSS